MNKKPRHSGEGRNPGNGDAVVNGRQILADAAFGLSCLWLSFPQSENGLLQLDSGLRWNDDGGMPAFTEQLRASSATCSRLGFC